MQKFIDHVDHVAWIVRPENTNIVLGDIDYQDGLIPFGRSDRPHSND